MGTRAGIRVPQIVLAGDGTADMAKIAAAYARKTAHVQANASPVRLHPD